MRGILWGHTVKPFPPILNARMEIVSRALSVEIESRKTRNCQCLSFTVRKYFFVLGTEQLEIIQTKAVGVPGRKSQRVKCENWYSSTSFGQCRSHSRFRSQAEIRVFHSNWKRLVYRPRERKSQMADERRYSELIFFGGQRLVVEINTMSVFENEQTRLYLGKIKCNKSSTIQPSSLPKHYPIMRANFMFIGIAMILASAVSVRGQVCFALGTSHFSNARNSARPAVLLTQAMTHA
ncbi:hypothetical protein B0H19DRAFT_1162509 [Mycena capillaripes]|nr:hypothetical protein B0H19DRAFT_1162509 [Mycena capillaripes]